MFALMPKLLFFLWWIADGIWTGQSDGSPQAGKLVNPKGNIANLSQPLLDSQSLLDLSVLAFGPQPVATSTAAPLERKTFRSPGINMSSAFSYDNDGDVVMADLEEMSGIMDIVSHVHGERFTHGEIQSEAAVKASIN